MAFVYLPYIGEWQTVRWAKSNERREPKMGDLVKIPLSEMNATLEVLGRLGVTLGHLKRIRADEGYAKQVAVSIIHGVLAGNFHPGNIYPVTIDYGLSFEQMIKAGNYDWVNENITSELFPFVGTGIVQLDAYFVHFGKRIMSFEAVPIEIDEMELRPVTLPELLAFGAKYPELQRRFPIAGLGSISDIHGVRLMAYLDNDERGRLLRLVWFGGVCPAGYHFLAVSK